MTARPARGRRSYRRRPALAVVRGVSLALALFGPGVSAAAGGGVVRPSAEYLSPELRAQQDDPSRHPGWLWVDAGEAAWRRAPGPDVASCAGCHGGLESMRGVATRLPAVGPDGRLSNLEGRINRCLARC